jgi:hypothetical protein
MLSHQEVGCKLQGGRFDLVRSGGEEAQAKLLRPHEKYKGSVAVCLALQGSLPLTSGQQQLKLGGGIDG